jgi:hypothetical protein
MTRLGSKRLYVRLRFFGLLHDPHHCSVTPLDWQWARVSRQPA